MPQGVAAAGMFGWLLPPRLWRWIMNISKVWAVASVLSCALVACTSAAPSRGNGEDVAASLAIDEGQWSFVRAESGPLTHLEAAREITLGFQDGRLYGSDGCNRYTTAYRLEGDRITVGSVATTKMMCLGDGDAVERAFLTLLTQPMTLRREGDALRLIADDGTVLHFAAFERVDR